MARLTTSRWASFANQPLHSLTYSCFHSLEFTAKAGGERQGPFMGGKPTVSILQTVGEGGAKPTHKARL